MTRPAARLATFSWLLAALLTVGAAKTQEGAGVRFHDIAVDDGAGITYRRTESPSEAIFEALRQKPVYVVATDLVATPDSSRGMPGVALVDVGSPGLLVLGSHEPNRLFENRGDGTFDEITEVAGFADAPVRGSASCAMGDVDVDALLDIAVAKAFDLTTPDSATITWGIALVDIDLDGDVDLVHGARRAHRGGGDRSRTPGPAAGPGHPGVQQR